MVPAPWCILRSGRENIHRPVGGKGSFERRLLRILRVISFHCRLQGLKQEVENFAIQFPMPGVGFDNMKYRD